MLPELFSGLLTLEEGFEGDCTERFQEIWPEIKRIRIGRGVSGPIFDFGSEGFVDEPLFERLYDKFFNKFYEVEYELEILLWVREHPLEPVETWEDLLTEEIESWISVTQFSRVWVFDYSNQEILFVCPELGESRSSQ
jgi:hypothetical protein